MKKDDMKKVTEVGPELPQETLRLVRKAFGKLAEIAQREKHAMADAVHLRKRAAEMEHLACVIKEQLDLFIGSATLLDRINGQIDATTVCTATDVKDREVDSEGQASGHVDFSG